jgi:plasmid stabilization system protein ParE
MTYRGLLTEEAKAELDHEIAYSKERWGAKHATVYRRELLERVRKIVRNPYVVSAQP